MEDLQRPDVDIQKSNIKEMQHCIYLLNSAIKIA